MRTLRNHRGTLTEFAFLIPLVVTTMLVALQLLLIITQRSETHAIADRIAFLAAAAGVSVALQEAELQQKLIPAISTITVTASGQQLIVTISATLDLIVPITELDYSVTAISRREP